MSRHLKYDMSKETKIMKIEYPKKDKNETEIGALLWYFLRKRKIDARLQVSAEKSRLDIVCFKDRQAVCIIECKGWSRSYSLVRQYRRNNSKQLQRYRALFNIPVFLCGRASDITKIQNEVLSLFH